MTSILVVVRHCVDDIVESLAGVGASVDKVVSSKSSEAVACAQRLSKEARLKGAPERSADLRAWDLGLSADAPYYLEHESDVPLGGESFTDFQTRALGAVHALMEEAKQSPGAIVAVTHASVLRLLNGWCAAGCPEDGAVDMAAMNKQDDEPAVLVFVWDGTAWRCEDEAALKQTKENAMRDPLAILGDSVATELGFDWGGVLKGAAATGATAIDESEKKKAADQSKQDADAALAKSLKADSAWVNAEVTLELAGGSSAASGARVMVDSAKSDAAEAGAALNADGTSKRCTAAKNALKDAAAAVTASPKDTTKQAKLHAWQKVVDQCGSGASDGKKGKGKGDGVEGGSFLDTLTTKKAGLPVWGWGVVAVGGVTLLGLLARHFLKKKR